MLAPDHERHLCDIIYHTMDDVRQIVRVWFERPVSLRHELIKRLSSQQLAELLATSEDIYGNPYALFKDDPVGFITLVLGEHLWSKQKEICEDMLVHKKIAIPATNGCGKSFLMARLVAWFVTCNDPAHTRVVTFAPSARQVRDILWNEVRSLKKKHPFLPGRVLQTEWKIDELTIANGFSCGGDADETKFQGIHKANILIIVDEAAGVAPHVGEALRAISTNDAATLVAIGNPPTGDDQGFKWFETICSNPDLGWQVRKITAWDLPSMTGEPVPQHAADGLTSKSWVEEIIRDFTPDEPWYKARLDAEFVDIGTSTAIPKEWVARSIGFYDATRAGVIRIGVDVSATGGDEYVVAVADGENVSIAYRSSGLDNQDQTVLADEVFKIAKQQLSIMQSRIARGFLDSESVVLRIDKGGLGPAVRDIIKKLIRQEGLVDHIRVEDIDFSERAFDAVRFKNKRAEMYWKLREDTRHAKVVLVADEVASRDEIVEQLSVTRLKVSDVDRRYGLESKKDMKARRVSSPDLADAIALAVYDVGYTPAIINAVPGTDIGFTANDTQTNTGFSFSGRRPVAAQPRTRYY